MSGLSSPPPPASGGDASPPSASSPSSSLHLRVKLLRGETLSISVPRSGTIVDVHAAIAHAASEAGQLAPVDAQRVIHKGKVLKREKRIEEYAIEDGDVLHLIVQQPAAPGATGATAPSAASPTSAGGAPASMPNLTPNNALPAVPPTPFPFPGFPAGIIPGAGGPIPGMPFDIGGIMQQVLGGLAAAGGPQHPGGMHSVRIDFQPNPPQPQQQASPPASGASPSAVPPAAATPSAADPSTPQQQQQPQPQPNVGIPVQQHVALHPQSHPALSVNAVRTFLTEVAQNIPRLTSQPPLAMDPRATMSSAASQSQAFPEDVSGLARLLAQTQAVTTQVAPPLISRLTSEIEHLAAPIRSPPSATHPDTPASRLALQQQLRMLSPGLRRIGDSLRGLATLLEAIQVHPQTGAASLLILPPHLQVGRQLHVAGPPMQQIRVNLGAAQPGQPIVVNFGAQPQAAAAQQAAGATPAAVAPSPSAAPSTPSAAPAAAGAPTGSAAQPAPFNFMSLLQQAAPMVAPLMANLGQPGQGGQAGQAGQASQPPNPMADIMSALGPMFAGLQPQPVGPNAAAEVPPAQPQAAAPPASAAAPASSPAAAPSAPPAGAPNLSNMLGSLMPMLGQMMQQPATAGGGGSLQNIISSMMGQLNPPAAVGAAASRDERMEEGGDAEDGDDDGDSSESVSLFDMFLSQIMAHLSLPDLMGLISGNWAGTEKVHGPFREMLLDLLQEDDEASRSLLSQSFASGIVESMLDEATIAPMESQRLDGQDPRRASAPVVRRHVRRLIDLILDTPVRPLPAEGTPIVPAPTSFSTMLKAWCMEFCGEWLVTLGRCYRDGLATSERIALSLVQTKFSSVGGSQMAMFLPMVSGTIVQVMMKAAKEFERRQMGQQDERAWVQHVPEAARARWQATIEVDERELKARRADEHATTLFKPLSYAYQAGGKKRPAGPSAAAIAPQRDTRMADQLHRTLQRAVESAGVASADAQRIVQAAPASLAPLFAEQVASDLRPIVQAAGADFSAQRFPMIDAEIVQTGSK